jgi:hypothetical protein
MSSIIQGIKESIEREQELANALKQSQQITKGIKYDETVMGIINEIQALAQKFNIDPKSLKWAIDDVLEARGNLESAVYGLDELFKDAWQEEKWRNEEEDLNEESKAEIRARLDKAIQDFLDKGGQIEKVKPNKVRAKPGQSLASRHIGTAGEFSRTRRSPGPGMGRQLGAGKPVVNVEEGYRAGAVGGAGLGIEKSPIEKVLEKPFKCSPVDEDGAPDLLKKEMPTHRHAEKLLAQNGVSKDDPDYHKHLSNTINHLRKFGNIDLINKQDVDEEQAPMFTPEEKMVNANDPRSDGWRFYKLKTGDTKESAIMKGLQTEAGGVTRWSKENPPPPELLLNTLIQILMKPENQKSPQDLVSLWNEKYGLKHTLGSLRQYAQNDYKKMELSKALQKAALANESFERK